jgi:hypothetical protein
MNCFWIYCIYWNHPVYIFGDYKIINGEYVCHAHQIDPTRKIDVFQGQEV